MAPARRCQRADARGGEHYSGAAPCQAPEHASWRALCCSRTESPRASLAASLAALLQPPCGSPAGARRARPRSPSWFVSFLGRLCAPRPASPPWPATPKRTTPWPRR